MNYVDYQKRGWTRIAPDAGILDWVDAVAPHAQSLLQDPELRAKWLRYGGTWFAGVNVLGANADGAVGNGPAMPTAVTDALDRLYLDWNGFDPGQLSVCYPGYPRRCNPST